MASLYVPSRIGSPTGNGYKLYFYQTGTTTPQNTYSQSDLAPGHENTNPVVADANGLFGPIYLLASPDYKAVLTNATGTTIWTTDPLLTAAASVITTEGDLIVGDSNGDAARLAIGASARYLRSNGTAPSWHTLDAADLSGSIPKANMPAGTVIQEVVTSTNAYSSHTTVIPKDNTLPLITEGDLLFTAAITPANTTNRVKARVLLHQTCSVAASCSLFRGTNILAAASTFVGGADAPSPLILEFDDVPGSVSAQSYTLRVGPISSTMYINGDSGSRLFGGVMISYMSLEEIVV